MSGTVVLKRGRAKPVLQRHPWIFSGAIERTEGEVEDGDIVEVRDAGHNWLARGYLNRRSQIAVRLLTWRQDELLDRAFWHQRLERAIVARQTLGADPATWQPHQLVRLPEGEREVTYTRQDVYYLNPSKI